MNYRQIKRELRQPIAAIIENEVDLGGLAARYPEKDEQRVVKAIRAIADEIRREA